MKKRILCLGLALVLTSSCFACSKEKNPASKDDINTTEATENDLTTSDENTTTFEEVTTEVIVDVTEPSSEEEVTTSEKETQKPTEKPTEVPTEAPTVESFKTVEEIINCLVENKWYTEPEKADNDVLFYYVYYDTVFYADGTLSGNVYRNLDENTTFGMINWSVTDDKKLVVYDEDSSIEYTWGDVESGAPYMWYLTKDTLMITEGLEIIKFSTVKTEFPEFTDVYETDYNELKSQLVNNEWWTKRNIVYEFFDNGILVGTGYDENGNKEIKNGNWSLSSDCVLQINIDGSENKSFNLLTFEVCKNHKGDFSYYDPYWWMNKDGNLRVGNLNVWRLDENFSDTYMIRYYLSTYVEAFIKGFGDQRFYTEKLLSERDNGFFDELFTTINNGKISSCSYDFRNYNRVVIVLENKQRYVFEVEIDKLTNKINKIKLV